MVHRSLHMGGGEMERRILRRAISIFAVFIILFSGVSLASAQELIRNNGLCRSLRNDNERNGNVHREGE